MLYNISFLTDGSLYFEMCCAEIVCFFAYQGIKHQRIKGVTVGVLHHNVEESIQSVL